MKDSFQLLKKYIYFYNSLKTHSLTRLRGKSRKTKERLHGMKDRPEEWKIDNQLQSFTFSLILFSIYFT